MAGHRWRSLLFAPGDRPDRVAKAFAAGADGVIVDLEDAVHASHLDDARAAVPPALAQARPGVTRIVRINAPSDERYEADLHAVVGPWLDVVMLPKAESAAEVRAVDERIAAAERAAGLPAGRIALAPVVESNAALRSVYDIARASTRVTAMGLASAEQGDLITDLGGVWTPDGRALHYAKSRFVSELRAAGDVVAIDGPCAALGDDELLRAECRNSRVLGFDGKVAIHPRQVPAIRAAFVPSPDELAAATSVVAAYRRAAEQGVGVIEHDGKMLDLANVRSAYRVIARADDADDIDDGPEEKHAED